MVTKTKLPQAVQGTITNLEMAGNTVWCIASPAIANGPWGQPFDTQKDQGLPTSECRLWIVLYKLPNFRRVYGYQWEQWTHSNEPKPRPIVRTSDWVWVLEDGKKHWNELVAKGWTRIV